MTNARATIDEETFETPMRRRDRAAIAIVVLLVVTGGFLIIRRGLFDLNDGRPPIDSYPYVELSHHFDDLPAIVGLADGSPREQGRRRYGLRYAVAPTAVAAATYPPTQFVLGLLEGGIPIVGLLEDPAHVVRTDSVLRDYAHGKSFGLRRQDLGENLVVWRREATR